ncbi:DnaJ isogeny subfamily C member 7 [Senna tora]|uniref:DnaJ isogeny subfamily C member 7 n=1 Tax=Senna tora TaxID=362788 RepID=A0A834WL46_9FABA|nr:DnaJ isogeny subfamily C member 7 [Senna tora]
MSLSGWQKVSEFIDCSAELLRRRTTSDAYRALELINEALMISSYSENLLEMKAESLFTLCKYEEVIQLCDQTLGSAETNFHSLEADGEVTNLDDSQLYKGFYFRLWRCSMKLKSYFYLGKLEEGLSSLEEQGEIVSSMNKNGSKVFDSLIPLAVTVRELLRHKSKALTLAPKVLLRGAICGQRLSHHERRWLHRGAA